MSAFVELLGGSLLGAGMVKKDTAEALAGAKAVAIYFSAHWCPPCRGFTPKLAEWYKKDLQGKGLEVVFVSSDRDENAFKEYFGEQPWLALPFEERELKSTLSKKFKVQGIPSLVILDSNAKKITLDGRSAVSNDPEGKEFPWLPIPPKTLLEQAKLVSASGEVSIKQAMEGKKALALYFSAHWCPPCRGFTPQMAEWYKKSLKDKGLEVIFISSDRDEGAFKEYFAEQPWLALDYTDRSLKEKLSNAFGVSGIPSLVILDAELNLVTKDGRAAVSADPEGTELPWHPKPVSDLKSGPGSINEVPTFLLFCEKSDASQQKAFIEAMEPLAKKFLAKAKEADGDPEVAFMMVTGGELAGRIRGMVGLPESGDTRMVLMDIPDEGGYYLGGEGVDITSTTVQEFIDKYQAKQLERKQLS
eukprot:TRINITY_DN741_c0_g1_i6.p1 TRINITY_DN741_c0_g1~~TRINITY_DN741_c0_g1_i6.p1  ORF type:complete len:417 (+),score=115.40 TRINITY_DN741_c0_g1_i6:109-1359(+)